MKELVMKALVLTAGLVLGQYVSKNFLNMA